MSDTRHEGESFADIIDMMRLAASGDFPGAPGSVWDNLRVLTGRGRGDSAVAMLNELCDRLERTHEREMRNPSRDYMQSERKEHAKRLELAREYCRGYDDGKRVSKRLSEVGDHNNALSEVAAAVAHRLRVLRFSPDSNSHERLSEIAKSIMPPSLTPSLEWHGWTLDACEALRDKLVLMLDGRGNA